MTSATDTVTTTSAAADRYPRPVFHAPLEWERKAVRVSLAAYFLVQLNAILHHGSWGQDFGSHLMFIARAYQSPWEFWTTYIEAQNNPPLFHLLCAAVFRVTRHIHSLVVISIITTLYNAGAIYLLYRLSLRLVASPALRVAAFVFLLFFPAGMIHAVVLAADSVATPTTLLLTYLMVRMAEAGRRPLREYLPWAVLALGALALAVSIKFTAVSLVPAAAAVIVVTWLGRATGARRMMVGLLVVVLAPAWLGVTTYRHYKKYQKSNLGVNMQQDPFGEATEMNVRSVLLPRAADWKLLRDSPPYNAPSEFVIDGHRRFEIAVPNRYSYIGLLHVGMFTDMMNFYQYDPHDNYFGPRRSATHGRMKLAVKTALPFTLAAVVAVPWMLLWSGYKVMLRRDGRDPAALPVLIVLTVAFAFFLIIVMFLPWVGALAGGYWLPRLTIPALLAFFFITFVTVGRTRLSTSKAGPAVVLACVVFQALLSISFLWPWGVNGPEHPPLPQLVASKMSVKATLDVRFVPQPAGTGDPLLTIGRWGVAQYVFARHDGRGNVRILYNQWGQTDVPESAPFPADPNRTYHIEIQTDPKEKVLTVRVDGTEALRVTTWMPIAAFRDEVHLLANPASGGLANPTFSGVEVSRNVTVRAGRRWGPSKRNHPLGT